MPELPSGTVTFLFTDVEGSTALLKRLGREYGHVLAEHQRILRETFAAHGGHEVDTQGDSFFVAFRRAKDAVAAAVAAQRDLAANEWPDGVELLVRMGLHTGEPQVGEQRYVGIGVHKAARIGAAGHGGQVLLSSTTRELIEDELPPGVTVRDLGERRLKDIDRPERLFQLEIEGLRSDFARLKTLDVELKRKRRRIYAGGALIGVLAAAVAIPIFALGQGSGVGSANVAPNSVAVIDPGSNRVSASVANVGITPYAIAAGGGAIWVANLGTKTLTRVDPATEAVVQTIPLIGTATGVEFASGAVWTANGLLGSVSRIDPSINQVTKTIAITVRSSNGFVAAEPGAVWVVFGNSEVARIDPTMMRVVARGIAGTVPSAIAIGAGAVWIANSADNNVYRMLPETATTVKTISVGLQPSGIAVGDGAVWVTNRGDDSVYRIDLRSGSAIPIAVGHGPTGIAVGPGAVWIANSADGTVYRIDPKSLSVVAKVRVGARPVGLALTPDGRVWVTVQAPM
jgi:YVTN family beta-propeller protein